MSHHVNRVKHPSPCQQACPAGIDVPRYIRQIRDGRFHEARLTVREKIPFSAVCGWACLHPCEAKCARNQFEENIAIRMLKLAAEEHRNLPEGTSEKPPSTGHRIAIIGSGPCGLTAAYFLSRLGHRPVVFEAQDKAGGLLYYGIPAYRLPRKAIEQEIDLIRAEGVEIRLKSPISSPKKLFQEGFSAVLVAVGAWQALALGIEGADSPLLTDGLSFLREVNAAGKTSLAGKKVIVVGGGNTAVDAARSSRRLGAEVTILYRRRLEDMPASAEEIEDALEEGVEIVCLCAPLSISGKEVTCQRMVSGPPDASGRPTPIPQSGSEFILRTDLLVAAIGQRPAAEALGIDECDRGRILVKEDTLATATPGLFAAGDAVLGPSSIIEAIAQGRKAAVSIDRFLGGDGLIDRHETENEDEAPEPHPRGVRRTTRIKIPPAERLRGFDEVERVLDRDAAMFEAGRCLSCDLRDYRVTVNDQLCKECGFCQEVCTLNVFETADYFNAQGYRPSLVRSDAHCIGCLRCLYICPDFAINIDDSVKRPDAALR